uniref:Uncharacterized protein n=1 Tax=Ascaris lumbricoides TaxID=6252 RepID=A0A0M3ILE9_ASCLU
MSTANRCGQEDARSHKQVLQIKSQCQDEQLRALRMRLLSAAGYMAPTARRGKQWNRTLHLEKFYKATPANGMHRIFTYHRDLINRRTLPHFKYERERVFSDQEKIFQTYGKKTENIQQQQQQQKYRTFYESDKTVTRSESKLELKKAISSCRSCCLIVVHINLRYSFHSGAHLNDSELNVY